MSPQFFLPQQAEFTQRTTLSHTTNAMSERFQANLYYKYLYSTLENTMLSLGTF